MRNLVIWNAVVILLTGATTLYVAPALRGVAAPILPKKDADLLRRTLMGMKRADDEHACWAARTMYHYLPQLPHEARRDLTRALFTS